MQELPIFGYYRPSRHLFVSTWCSWWNSICRFESKIQSQRESRLGSFQNTKVGKFEGCTHRVVCFWVRAQLSENQQSTSVKFAAIVALRTFYTNIILATVSLKKMNAFLNFKMKINLRIWFFGRLAKDIIVLKFWLSLQILFQRIVHTKRMKTKDSEESLQTSSTMFTRKSGGWKGRTDNITEFPGHFEKYCKVEVKRLCSTMNDPKIAYAERTIRYLEKFLYCYLDDYGNKYTHTWLNLWQPWTLERSLRKIWHQGMSKTSNICAFCSTNQYENIKNTNSKMESGFTTPDIIHFSGKDTSCN